MIYDELKRATRGLAAMLASTFEAIDWWMVAIVGAFLAAVWWAHHDFFALVTERDPAHLAYEAAIADAAVKHPSYGVQLRTIPTTSTTVHLAFFDVPDAFDTNARSFDISAAMPDELRAACKGAQKPFRRLQEILGLPPVDAPNNVVKELEVQRSALVRPCIEGGDLASPFCALELSESNSAPAADTGGAGGANGGAGAGGHAGAVGHGGAGGHGGASGSGGTAGVSGTGGVVSASSNPPYDGAYFLKQIWNTHRVEFRASKVKAADYPYTGSPFTGMGWTYDWSNVPNHIGVSEFVIRRNAPVKVINAKTPAEFCAP